MAAISDGLSSGFPIRGCFQKRRLATGCRCCKRSKEVLERRVEELAQNTFCPSQGFFLRRRVRLATVWAEEWLASAGFRNKDSRHAIVARRFQIIALHRRRRPAKVRLPQCGNLAYLRRAAPTKIIQHQRIDYQVKHEDHSQDARAPKHQHPAALLRQQIASSLRHPVRGGLHTKVTSLKSSL